MKHLKLFESMNQIEVEKICKKYYIENWSINKDGLVDVDGDVNLNFKGITELPLQFGGVTGNFRCFLNSLTTLKGGPTEVVGNFDCDLNKLTTLEGAPQEVGGGFYCRSNNLTTLKGAPEYIDGKVDFLPNRKLPAEFLNFLKLNDDRDLQTYILKWQKDYAIWRKDGSFNKANFIRMMEDAQDELKIKIKFPK